MPIRGWAVPHGHTLSIHFPLPILRLCSGGSWHGPHHHIDCSAHLDEYRCKLSVERLRPHEWSPVGGTFYENSALCSCYNISLYRGWCTGKFIMPSWAAELHRFRV